MYIVSNLSKCNIKYDTFVKSFLNYFLNLHKYMFHSYSKKV